ncbi:MAG: hypothetical protein E7509_04825 [Ruminococcus sp.]|nr:hypothetical protein [Ruminococcus sp.]
MKLGKIISLGLALAVVCVSMTACVSESSVDNEKTTTTSGTNATTTIKPEGTTPPENTTTTPTVTDAPDTPENPGYAINEAVSYDKPYSTTVPDGKTKATITLVPIYSDSEDGVAWNAQCSLKIVVTAADGSKTYAAVIGESVIWDVIVDENEVVAVNDCHVMWSDDVSSDVVVNVSGGAKIEVIALSWNNLPEEKSTPYFKVGNIVYQ